MSGSLITSGRFVINNPIVFMHPLKRLILIFNLLVFVTSASAQKVGLVLSGGGAKGIAHIGVLQAFEDNGIPIDYVAGTSMGAVVGGLYAMGYSPAEMLALIKSDDFNNWKNGTVEQRYVNFFRLSDPTPESFRASISLKDSVLNPKKMLPNSLLNPIQLNLAFLQLCTQITGQCRGDFNQLFIPFRSVASDVNKRQAYIFRKGDLGDAIRASMTFPFVFKAIHVNGVLLYDGGIYNNYPVDIMIEDFQPDVVLGCVVSDINRKKPDDYDLVGQLQNMIIHPGIDKIPDGKGVQLDLDLSSVSLLAFNQADSVYKIGYDGAMAKIDTIKKMINRRVDPLTLSLKRALFKSHTPELRFRKIVIKGVTDIQRDYILKVLKQDGQHFFTLEDFKIGYFKLMTESKIKEIVPHAVYDPDEQSFELILDVDMENAIDVSLGANLSLEATNQLYMGVGYQVLNEYSQFYSAGLYVGKLLNALTLNGRFNFTGNKVPQYLSIQFTTTNLNFFQGEKLFYQDDRPAFIKQYESGLKVKYGLPLFQSGKLEIGLGGGYLRDSYMQTKLESFTSESFDKSIYGLGVFSIRLEQNNLNDKQYATAGVHRYVLGQYISGMESYRYPDSVGNLAKTNKNLRYVQVNAGFESYRRMKKPFILGFKGEFVYNNKRALDNYTSSIIQAPAFSPTPHSLVSFNEAFRANRFVGFGVLPIWNMRESLYLRSEFYGFLPIQGLTRGENQEAITGFSWSNAQYLAEMSLVYKLPNANISLFLNNYSYPDGNWNIGLNIGYLIFNRRFLE
jgi:NTE family protein